MSTHSETLAVVSQTVYHTIMVYAAILCAIGLGMPTRTPPSAIASRATAIYTASISMLRIPSIILHHYQVLH